MPHAGQSRGTASGWFGLVFHVAQIVTVATARMVPDLVVTSTIYQLVELRYRELASNSQCGRENGQVTNAGGDETTLDERLEVNT